LAFKEYQIARGSYRAISLKENLCKKSGIRIINRVLKNKIDVIARSEATKQSGVSDAKTRLLRSLPPKNTRAGARVNSQ
jgi:hypothetical protein